MVYDRLPPDANHQLSHLMQTAAGLPPVRLLG
jgi:hypothetical protein